MSALIQYVRDLINDPMPGEGDCDSVFTNDQVQQVLDQHRFDVFQLRLQAADDIVDASGVINWKQFYARYGFWELDYRLQLNTFAVTTADTADAISGTWSFNTSQTLPIYLTGKHYDVYAAAVDLLIRWKAKLTLQYDVNTSVGSFQRSQRIANLDGLIKSYRGRMLPRVIKVVRKDEYHSVAR